ncbi:MAG: PilZ domain-containing protein [Syntrophaceae bacterium]|nr:PilZ domain-containing protein [Syntrophaceae bacterium]
MDEHRHVDRLFEIISHMSVEEQKKLLDDLESREIKKARKHSREERLITVNYASKGRAYQNFIQDISTEGAFLETKAPFSVGDTISLAISYSKEQRPFKIEAEVVRIDPNGVGIRFKKVSQVQEELINSIIEKTAKLKK